MIALYWSGVTGAASHPEGRADTRGVLRVTGCEITNNVSVKVVRSARAGSKVLCLIRKLGWELLLCPVVSVRCLRDTSKEDLDGVIQYLDDNPEYCRRLRTQLGKFSSSEVDNTIITLASSVITTAKEIFNVVEASRDI